MSGPDDAQIPPPPCPQWLNDAPAALARKIRVAVVRMLAAAKASHIGSCYSVADILAVLYARILRVTPGDPACPSRDRLVLSKGHAAAALYAALAESGFFPRQWLQGYAQDGTLLPGHATHAVPGVDASTGSLGHGLPLACGMALAGRADKRMYRVFAILSDGECDEGSIWEAAIFAAHHKLDNLVAIVDYNKLQGFGRTSEVADLEPFLDKWAAFRWSVREVDGHNYDCIEHVLRGVPWTSGRPSVLIAHTVKGRGVGFMEDQLLWHYRSPSPEQLRRVLAELGNPE